LISETGVPADWLSRVELHYLDGSLSMDLFLPDSAVQAPQLASVRQALHAFTERHAYVSAVRVHQTI